MKKTWKVPSVECLNVSETHEGFDDRLKQLDGTGSISNFTVIQFVNRSIPPES